MTENYKYFEKLISEVDQAEVKNMFGKPCGKINKKAFAAYYLDQMVFRIGSAEIEKLLIKYSGTQNWDPSGKSRPMKDWIQVPDTHKKDWKKLLKKALDFTATK